MRIAILGTRGIPAKYGGFETCAEELGVRLVERGHQVTVYCRYGNWPENLAAQQYKGVKLVYIHSLRLKATDTLSHTFFSMGHALFHNYDILLVFNAANAPICTLPSIFGKSIAINVDGLEWKRRKWGIIAKKYYKLAEWLSTKVGFVISDSRAIQDYYLKEYNSESYFVAYGAHIESSDRPEILKEYMVNPGEYLFVASRLEPENNADLSVAAFERVKTDKKLLIAGGANWNSPFVREIKKTKDSRIIFLGPIYKDGHIKELHCNCYAYIHGNEVGGTNPALLKALGYGNCVFALNVPFNAEVVQDAGLLYDKDVTDLQHKIQFILNYPDQAEEYRRKAVQRVKEAYTWNGVVDGYEDLFYQMLTYFKK
jgi:glycosyltransferase involved in cell wall biosynthesis